MSGRIARIEAILARCNDSQVLELHRIVSRRASLVRSRDPEYQVRRLQGMLARERFEAIESQR